MRYLADLVIEFLGYLVAVLFLAFAAFMLGVTLAIIGAAAASPFLLAWWVARNF